ncbi:MAG: porin [Planctomycetaceae bacterium]
MADSNPVATSSASTETVQSAVKAGGPGNSDAYSYIDLTDNDITGGIGHSGTLALNWFFNEYAKLQFNLIYGSIHDRGPIGGYTSGTYLIAGTRLAIEF